MSMVLSSLINTQSKLRPKIRFLLYCQAGEVGGGIAHQRKTFETTEIVLESTWKWKKGETMDGSFNALFKKSDIF